MSRFAIASSFFPFFFETQPLTFHDLQIFADDFAMAASLLPADEVLLLPADIDGDLSLPEGTHPFQAISRAWKKKKNSRVAPGSWLVLIENSEGEYPGAALLEKVHDEDVFEKELSLMSSLLGRECERLKWGYVDCATGLLNGQYLKKRFEEVCREREGATFFFFSVSSAKKNTPTYPMAVEHASAALFSRVFPKVIPVVSLGGGVYVAIAPPGDAENIRCVARSVVEQFRGHKWRSACCGLVVQGDGESVPKDLDQAFGACLARGWTTLEKAQRYGPFSVCIAGEQESGELQLLHTLPQQVLKTLKKQTATLPVFSLALFEDDTAVDTMPSLVDALEQIDDIQGHVVASEIGPVFVLFPHMDGVRAEQKASHIQDKLSLLEENNRSVTVGIASFPACNASKTAVIENAVKALLHARFFAPKGRALFDHISLNVAGDVYFNEGDFTSAIKEYQKGLDKKPEDINLLNSAGVACGQLNKHDRAASYFTRVLQHDPDNFMALANLGHSSLFHGDREHALQFFKRCLAVAAAQEEPHDLFEVVVPLARLLFLHDRCNEAMDLIGQWWERVPSDAVKARMLAVKGEICIEEERQDEARKYLQEAQRLLPHDPHIMSLLAVAYALNGNNRDVAASLCAKALEEDKTKNAFWRRKGLVHFLHGEQDKAKHAVSMALSLNKHDSNALYLMGCVAEQAGQFRQAARHFKKIVLLQKASPLSQRKATEALARLDQ